MKPLATLALLAVLALPAGAAVVHDETVNGDLSTNPAAPTALAFSLGGNAVIGSVRNTGTPPDAQDYITFTVPANHLLNALNLLSFSPTNIAFAAFNAGTTSFIPDLATDPLFLSGIHVTGSDTGTNLMPLFVTSNVTSNALPDPWLGPGNYCFLIQQANAITTSYRLEFVLDGAVPTHASTWGVIKRLYR